MESHLLWFDLVHRKGLEREQAHQLDMADEKWRELLSELGGKMAQEALMRREEEGEKGKADSRAEAERRKSLFLIQGATFQEVTDGNFPEILERIVEIKEVLLAVQKGEDTRKFVRRMSRRQSKLGGISI